MMNSQFLVILFVKRPRVEPHRTGGRKGHHQTLERERGYNKVRRLER